MAATEKNEFEIEQARQLKYVPWCREYERMISGMRYASLVPELMASRFKARKWCHKYNNWFPHDDPKADFGYLMKARSEMLKEILGSVGADSFIEAPFTVDYGCNIKIGEGFYANFNCCILDGGLVEIGDQTMFGPGVGIYTARHEVEIQGRLEKVEYTRPVRIGSDCWIGANAIILSGVTIGRGCTIGASSVVTKDIPDWSVAVGLPAKVVRKVTPANDGTNEASS